MRQLLERCKGKAAFDAAVYEALDRIQRKVPGALARNWFQIGYDRRGVLGICCFTCDDSRDAKAVGTSRTAGPFFNFEQHCNSAKHEKARADIDAEIDAILAKPGVEATRCAPCAPTRAHARSLPVPLTFPPASRLPYVQGASGDANFRRPSVRHGNTSAAGGLYSVPA